MFFRTTRGSLVPISRIAMVRKAMPPDQIWYVDLVDGDEETISDREAQRLQDLPVAYLPAEAGTRLLDATDPEFEPVSDQVIGWAIDSAGMPTAITPDGLMSEMANKWVIAFPSGYVSEPLVQSWDTVEKYIADVRASSAPKAPA